MKQAANNPAIPACAMNVNDSKSSTSFWKISTNVLTIELTISVSSSRIICKGDFTMSNNWVYVVINFSRKESRALSRTSAHKSSYKTNN